MSRLSFVCGKYFAHRVGRLSASKVKRLPARSRPTSKKAPRATGAFLDNPKRLFLGQALKPGNAFQKLRRRLLAGTAAGWLLAGDGRLARILGGALCQIFIAMARPPATRPRVRAQLGRRKQGAGQKNNSTKPKADGFEHGFHRNTSHK